QRLIPSLFSFGKFELASDRCASTKRESLPPNSTCVGLHKDGVEIAVSISSTMLMTANGAHGVIAIHPLGGAG
ncbi:MAG TPA: hypothetical protein PKW52_08330, partial [Nitrospira sp.]|nr:hypothetical protein [Nitrospira sp.]